MAGFAAAVGGCYAVSLSAGCGIRGRIRKAPLSCPDEQLRLLLCHCQQLLSPTEVVVDLVDSQGHHQFAHTECCPAGTEVSGTHRDPDLPNRSAARIRADVTELIRESAMASSALAWRVHTRTHVQAIALLPLDPCRELELRSAAASRRGSSHARKGWREPVAILTRRGQETGHRRLPRRLGPEMTRVS
jgi:hypothetical protein